MHCLIFPRGWSYLFFCALMTKHIGSIPPGSVQGIKSRPKGSEAVTVYHGRSSGNLCSRPREQLGQLRQPRTLDSLYAIPNAHLHRRQGDVDSECGQVKRLREGDDSNGCGLPQKDRGGADKNQPRPDRLPLHRRSLQPKNAHRRACLCGWATRQRSRRSRVRPWSTPPCG